MENSSVGAIKKPLISRKAWFKSVAYRIRVKIDTKQLTRFREVVSRNRIFDYSRFIARRSRFSPIFQWNLRSFLRHNGCWKRGWRGGGDRDSSRSLCVTHSILEEIDFLLEANRYELLIGWKLHPTSLCFLRELVQPRILFSSRYSWFDDLNFVSRQRSVDRSFLSVTSCYFQLVIIHPRKFQKIFASLIH